jgi:protein TonB
VIGTRHLLFGVAVSTLLHLALIVVWLYQDKNPGSLAQGEAGLLVSVGIAGSFSELAKDSTEASDSEMPEWVEQEEKKPEAEPEPEPQPEPEPESEIKPAPKPEPKPKLKKPTKPKAKPRPKPKPVPKAQAKPVVEAKPTKTEATQKTGSKSQSQALATRATGSGERVETGGNVGARADYLSVVMARIARQKKYPRSARRDGVTGTVKVKFVIRKNGKIKHAELVTSSGDKRLDKEALAMLKRASPLPAIPSNMGDESMTLTLPIEFSLTAKKSLF